MRGSCELAGYHGLSSGGINFNYRLSQIIVMNVMSSFKKNSNIVRSDQVPPVTDSDLASSCKVSRNKFLKTALLRKSSKLGVKEENIQKKTSPILQNLLSRSIKYI